MIEQWKSTLVGLLVNRGFLYLILAACMLISYADEKDKDKDACKVVGDTNAENSCSREMASSVSSDLIPPCQSQTTSNTEHPVPFKDLLKPVCQIHKTFIRTPEIMQKRYGDQSLFEAKTELTIIQMAKTLRENPQSPFNEVLSFLASERHKLALELNPLMAYQFGHPRTNNNYPQTPITGVYAGWLNRARNLCGKKDEYQFVFEGHQKRIYKLTRLSCIDWGEIQKPYFDHTSFEEMSSLMTQEIDPLYRSIFENNSEESEEILLKKLGRLHWLLAHAMPFMRGSASISENLIRAILLAKGFSAPPFKKDHFPDLDALTDPDIDRFSTEYRSMFLESPRKNMCH